MKALTVKQPWAYLICAGIKDIENRTWKTNFRGRILIHAGADKHLMNIPPGLFMTDEQFSAVINVKFPHREWNLYSAITGSVEIVDCVRNHPSIWAEKDCWNWVLANPILFAEPVENVKGKLSFWENGYNDDIKTMKL
jgi:hypothetical protein